MIKVAGFRPRPAMWKRIGAEPYTSKAAAQGDRELLPRGMAELRN